MEPPATGEDTLQQLMQRAQQGDGDAYLALLQEIWPVIQRVVRRRRGFLGPGAVEDLVQDVLLSVHAVRATYDPARPFTPWLMAIVRNRLADAARRHARQDARVQSLDGTDVGVAPEPSTASPHEFKDPEALVQAIGDLPPGQRQAIRLLKLDGLSLKEASAATGLSVGALKLATHRAMAALRRVLNGTPDED